MQDLDDELYEQIVELSEKGNELADNKDYEEAIIAFRKALDFVPLPKTDWEASLWLYASIGDMFFSLQKYDEAANNMYDALNCTDGFMNPFVHLRLGEASYETHNLEKAKEHLLQAYMLDGEDIFEDEDPKYFTLIKDLV